tara:strand:- start:1293 stop:1922 length:630 start_codon:yes stop_codon:yes gene_type:complete
MLIPLDQLVSYFNLNIKGILHIGAHECEELDTYLSLNVLNENIYWIEAMQNKVDMMKEKISDINIYQALIDINDNELINFNIADNGQSSSILDFGTHSKHHPHVKMIKKKQLLTTRLDTLIEKNNIPIKNINFLNLDIQGKELDALKSMEKYLDNIHYIYTEVNTENVYKDCGLLSEIDDFLKKHKFIRVACKMWGNCGWGDAFYIKTF